MNILTSIPLLLLSYIFLTAARNKFKNFSYTQESISNYQLMPQGSSATLVMILIATEIAAGILVLIPGFATLGMSLAASLLFIYSAAIAINLLRGRTSLDCGCNGPDKRQFISKGLLLRNLLLLTIVSLMIWKNLSLAQSVLTWLVAIFASCFFVIARSSFEQLRVNHKKIVELH